MKKILALDLGRKTGWSHSDGPSGVWDFKIRRDESAGMRLVRLLAKLREVKKSLGVELVVFEGVRFSDPKRRGASLVLAEMVGVVKTWCEKNGIDYRGYSPTEIKRHAIPGKGKRDKGAMLEAARERWPEVEFVDDNHADSRWLLDLIQTELGEINEQAC